MNHHELERRRGWHRANPERTRAISRRWRSTHRAIKYATRVRYYARNRANPENTRNSHTRWTSEDVQAILRHRLPDRVLSRRLGRTIKAIQDKRGVCRDAYYKR
ncbi:MAG: hypothetical protein HY093_01040 [Candidatus Liptonbacteria bacterium]|nr:hypothetical protein [Candidatus Liptonbacteria bacterium]